MKQTKIVDEVQSVLSIDNSVQHTLLHPFTNICVSSIVHFFLGFFGGSLPTAGATVIVFAVGGVLTLASVAVLLLAVDII